MSKTEKTTSVLGRLTALGPQEPWQVALLLPRDWYDLRQVVDDFSPARLAGNVGVTVVVRGRLGVMPTTSQRPPRTTAVIEDPTGNRLSFTIFGNARDTRLALIEHGDDLCLVGKLNYFNDRLQMNADRWIDSRWAGRMLPKYPAKAKVIGADKVRERMFEHLRTAIPVAADFIRQQAADGDNDLIETWVESILGRALPLESLLVNAHAPRTPAAGEGAKQVLEQLAAVALVKHTMAENKLTGFPTWRLTANSTLERGKQMPFTLNDGQLSAITEILDDLAEFTPMHRMLTGDVGTGKTAVYGMTAVVAADNGARVAVLAPNTGLVEQVTADMKGWWPDVDVIGVTGSTSKKLALDSAQILVGTTALLNRPTGKLDYIIVDEQHKFSREQREQLRRNGCHLLEATATCTPRAQALTELGINKTSQLKSRPVNNRVVETRLWVSNDKTVLMGAIEASVNAGEQVLVIYPERGEDVATDPVAARRQATGAYDIWERLFPGQVRMAHGGLSNEAKVAAIDDMKQRRASILISTTVVEVGINIPGLMRVVVIHADVLGMVTLHQIRGRVARAGGTGHCDLYTEKDMTGDNPAANRLKVLCETDDGFAIAEKDMRLRGFGDLARQSSDEKGFLDGLLFQRQVTPAMVEEAIKLLAI